MSDFYCVQAPVKVPSLSSLAWFVTLPLGPRWQASRPPTAMAAAATLRCALRQLAWSRAAAPPPASCPCAPSQPPCSFAWALTQTLLALPRPCPATASPPASGTHWWASWATTACAAPWPTRSASTTSTTITTMRIPTRTTTTTTTTRSSTTPASPVCAGMTSPIESRWVWGIFSFLTCCFAVCFSLIGTIRKKI